MRTLNGDNILGQTGSIFLTDIHTNETVACGYDHPEKDRSPIGSIFTPRIKKTRWLNKDDMIGPCERSDGNYPCLDGVAHAAPSIRQPVSDYSVARQVLQIEPVRAKKTAQERRH